MKSQLVWLALVSVAWDVAHADDTSARVCAQTHVSKREKPGIAPRLLVGKDAVIEPEAAEPHCVVVPPGSVTLRFEGDASDRSVHQVDPGQKLEVFACKRSTPAGGVEWRIVPAKRIKECGA